MSLASQVRALVDLLTTAHAADGAVVRSSDTTWSVPYYPFSQNPDAPYAAATAERVLDNGTLLFLSVQFGDVTVAEVQLTVFRLSGDNELFFQQAFEQAFAELLRTHAVLFAGDAMTLRHNSAACALEIERCIKAVLQAAQAPRVQHARVKVVAQLRRRDQVAEAEDAAYWFSDA